MAALPIPEGAVQTRTFSTKGTEPATAEDSLTSKSLHYETTSSFSPSWTPTETQSRTYPLVIEINDTTPPSPPPQPRNFPELPYPNLTPLGVRTRFHGDQLPEQRYRIPDSDLSTADVRNREVQHPACICPSLLCLLSKEGADVELRDGGFAACTPAQILAAARQRFGVEGRGAAAMGSHVRPGTGGVDVGMRDLGVAAMTPAEISAAARGVGDQGAVANAMASHGRTVQQPAQAARPAQTPQQAVVAGDQAEMLPWERAWQAFEEERLSKSKAVDSTDKTHGDAEMGGVSIVPRYDSGIAMVAPGARRTDDGVLANGNRRVRPVDFSSSSAAVGSSGVLPQLPPSRESLADGHIGNGAMYAEFQNVGHSQGGPQRLPVPPVVQFPMFESHSASEFQQSPANVQFEHLQSQPHYHHSNAYPGPQIQLIPWAPHDAQSVPANVQFQQMQSQPHYHHPNAYPGPQTQPNPWGPADAQSVATSFPVNQGGQGFMAPPGFNDFTFRPPQSYYTHGWQQYPITPAYSPASLNVPAGAHFRTNSAPASKFSRQQSFVVTDYPR